MRRFRSGGLRSSVRPALVVAAALVAVLVLAPAASAAPKRVASFWGSAGAGDGQFSATTGVGGVAINQNGVGGAAAGDVYVVDRGGHRVERFDASGAFKGAFGLNVGGAGINTCTTGCVAGTSGTVGGAFATPQSVAVDQVDGSVYVLDGANLRIQKFTATGTFVWAVGQNVLTGSPATGTVLCTVAANCKIGTTGAQGGTFASTFTGQVAVDPATRTLYVTDPANRRVQQLTAAGAFVRTFGFDVDAINPSTGFEICTIASECKIAVAAASLAAAAQGQFPTNQPTRIAIDSAGSIYTVESNISFRLQKFTPFGIGLARSFFAPVITGGATNDTPTDVAVDPGSGHVLVARTVAADAASRCPSGASSVAERRILELDPADAELLDIHMTCGAINVVNSLAVRDSNAATADAGNLYVSSTTDGQRVYRLTADGAATPGANVAAATSISAHGATLNGQIDRNDPASAFPLLWRFEYSKDGVNWISAPAANATISGATSDPVPLPSQVVTGLQANTTYRVRIVATKQYNAARVISAESTFDTPAQALEDVATLPADGLTKTTARLNGTLNANNQPTTWRFEYTTDADFQENGWANATSTPEGSGGGGTTTTMSRTIAGLEPATTYRYRIVVANDLSGTVNGSDRAFTTATAVPLPDDRAYELVTPADKRSGRGPGRYVDGPEEANVQAASPSSDGNRAVSASTPQALGEPRFLGASDLVFSDRTADGWRSRSAFTKPNYSPSGGFGGNGFAPLTVTPDFSRQIYDANSSYLFPELVPIIDQSKQVIYSRDWDSTWGVYAPTAAGQRVSLIGPTYRAVLAEDGSRAAISGISRGLAGPDDPTVGQLAGSNGGRSVYVQDLTTVAEGFGNPLPEPIGVCTGAGSDRTLIPERTADATPKLGAQACPAGQALISSRGSSMRDLAATGNETTPLTNAISQDGSRIFFHSPDPAVSTAPATCSTAAGATGSATSCPAQLYAWLRDEGGAARTRWISRTRVADQAATLMTRSIFEGASKDGMRVFFRTNAPLTDDDPNGGCLPLPCKTGSAGATSWDLYEYAFPTDPEADPGNGTLTRISAGPLPSAQGTGVTASGSPTVTVTATTAGQFAVGQVLVAPGVPAGTSITAVVGSALTLSANATATSPDGGVSLSAGSDPDVSAGAAPSRYGALRLLSNDGTRAYFVSAIPVPGARIPADAETTPGRGGTLTAPTANNLYLYDANETGADRWTFVARLDRAPDTDTLRSCALTSTTVGQPLAGNASQGLSGAATNCVRGTPDGRFITFMTTSRLTGDDVDDAVDVYAFDAREQRVSRVSAPQVSAGPSTPYSCGGLAIPATCNGDLGLDSAMNTPQLNISTDGSEHPIVYFQSGRRLVDAAPDGRFSVYQWQDGELTPITFGDGDGGAFYSGNTADGHDVFIATARRLTWDDVDSQVDVYDARVGGGFPEPAAHMACDLPAGGCHGDGASSVQGQIDTSRPDAGNVALGERPRLAVGALSAAQRRKAARSGVLPVRVSTNRPTVVRLLARARVSGGVRRVAQVTKRVKKAGTVTARLHLNGRAKKALRSGRKLRVSVEVRSPGARARTLTVLLPGAGS